MPDSFSTSDTSLHRLVPVLCSVDALSPENAKSTYACFLLWEEAEHPKGESSQSEVFLMSTDTWLFLWLASLKRLVRERSDGRLVKPYPPALLKR